MQQLGAKQPGVRNWFQFYKLKKRKRKEEYEEEAEKEEESGKN